MESGDKMLVTIEGIDGAGKSTLVATLKDTLADLNPVITREPGFTWIGDSVRRAITENVDPIAEALLFAADHAAHLKNLIIPELKKRKLIISDRYIHSRYAYQQVTLAKVLDNPLTWLKAVHNGWTIMPDLTFLLTMPVESALERTKQRQEDAEHFEKIEVLTKVQDYYLQFAKEDPLHFVIIDATRPQDDIIKCVSRIIRTEFKK